VRTLDILATSRTPPAQRYYRLQKPRLPAISLAQAKSHLRVDHDDDNDQIQRFINAAISHLDGSGRERDGLLGRALMNQVWVLEAERPDRGRIPIEHGIVQDIVDVDVISTGVSTGWDSSKFRLGFRDGEAFIVPVAGQSFPPHDDREDAFTVTYICGYGDRPGDLPGNLIEAMLLHIGHLYENREGVVLDARGQAVTVPFGYMDHVGLTRIIPIV
jgi:uncharacterized phiE125 gp8 family phage protein